jgi:hypothetical protein
MLLYIIEDEAAILQFSKHSLPCNRVLSLWRPHPFLLTLEADLADFEESFETAVHVIVYVCWAGRTDFDLLVLAFILSTSNSLRRCRAVACLCLCHPSLPF